MIVFQVIELCATFIETLIGVFVVSHLSSRNSIKWRESILAASIIMIIVWILNQYQLFSVVTTITAVSCFAICTSIIYKANIVDAFICSICYIVLLYIIDFLSISILGIFFQSDQIANILTSSFSNVRLSLLIISKGLLLLVCIFMKRYFVFKTNYITWKVKGVGILGVGIIYYLVRSTFIRADMNIVLTWLFLLALVILLVYTIGQHTFFAQEQNKMVTAMENITKRYDAMMNTYRKNRLFYHDLKNQYLVIENYLKSEEYVKAKSYMEGLKNADCTSSTNIPLRKWTGIEVLDVLIAHKKSEAERLNIKMDIAADLIELKLEENEIIALFGNALDNSIEACKKIDSENKKIQIIIRKIREMTFIKIRNFYKEEPEEKEGILVSKKKEKSLHGVGISSMKMVVDKYSGSMSINYGQGIFTVIISFFC